MIRIGSVVWGVRDVRRGVAFWTAALGYAPVHDPDTDWALLAPAAGRGPQLALKEVGAETNPSPHHHLDLYADDREAEVARLIGLGASEVEWDYERAPTTSCSPTRTATASAWSQRARPPAKRCERRDPE